MLAEMDSPPRREVTEGPVVAVVLALLDRRERLGSLGLVALA